MQNDAKKNNNITFRMSKTFIFFGSIRLSPKRKTFCEFHQHLKRLSCQTWRLEDTRHFDNRLLSTWSLFPPQVPLHPWKCRCSGESVQKTASQVTKVMMMMIKVMNTMMVTIMVTNVMKVTIMVTNTLMMTIKIDHQTLDVYVLNALIPVCWYWLMLVDNGWYWLIIVA